MLQDMRAAETKIPPHLPSTWGDTFSGTWTNGMEQFTCAIHYL